MRVRKKMRGGLNGYSVGNSIARKKMPARQIPIDCQCLRLGRFSWSYAKGCYGFPVTYRRRRVYSLVRGGRQPTRKGCRRLGLLNSSVVALL